MNYQVITNSLTGRSAMSKKLMLFACIGLFSSAAMAQGGTRTKPAPSQEPVKVAPVAKEAPTATVSKVEPAATRVEPATTATGARATTEKSTKKNGMTKVKPKTAQATAMPVDNAKQK